MKPGALARLRRQWSKKGRRKESSRSQPSLLNASQETCSLSSCEEKERVRFLSNETVHIIPGRWSMTEEQIASLWFSQDDFQRFRNQYYEWLYTEGGFEKPAEDSKSNEKSVSFLRGDSAVEKEKNIDGVLCIDWDDKGEEESVWRSLRFCRDGRPQVLWSRVEEVDASDDDFSSDSDSSSESEGEEEEEEGERGERGERALNKLLPPPLTVLTSDEELPLKGHLRPSSATVTPLLTPVLSPYPYGEEPVDEDVSFGMGVAIALCS